MGVKDFILSFRKKKGMAVSVNRQLENEFLPAYYEYRTTEENFRHAVACATSKNSTSTDMLQDIYNSISSDAKVANAMMLRMNAVIDKQYGLYDKKGKVNTELTNATCGAWLNDAVRYAFESKFYWYSLLFFQKDEMGEITGIELVDRRNVLPLHTNGPQLLHHRNETQGLNIKDFPTDLILVQLDKSNTKLGLMHDATYLVLKKRVFMNLELHMYKQTALPLFTVSTSNPAVARDKDGKIQEVLRKLPKSGSAILPQDSVVQVLESSRTAFDPLRVVVDSYNRDVDQLIIGQTMVTNDGASRSQAETHFKVFQSILKTDSVQVLNWLNVVLLPFLRNSGYNIPDEYIFDIDGTLSPEEQKEIDLALLDRGIRIKKEVLEERYNIEMEDYLEKTANSRTEAPEEPEGNKSG